MLPVPCRRLAAVGPTLAVEAATARLAVGPKAAPRQEEESRRPDRLGNAVREATTRGGPHAAGRPRAAAPRRPARAPPRARATASICGRRDRVGVKRGRHCSLPSENALVAFTYASFACVVCACHFFYYGMTRPCLVDDTHATGTLNDTRTLFKCTSMTTSPRQHAGALQLWPERCGALEADGLDPERAGCVDVGRVIVHEDDLVRLAAHRLESSDVRLG